MEQPERNAHRPRDFVGSQTGCPIREGTLARLRRTTEQDCDRGTGVSREPGRVQGAFAVADDADRAEFGPPGERLQYHGRIVAMLEETGVPGARGLPGAAAIVPVAGDPSRRESRGKRLAERDPGRTAVAVAVGPAGAEQHDGRMWPFAFWQHERSGDGDPIVGRNGERLCARWRRHFAPLTPH
nr:hypothetical protein [Nocardia transvalensis]